MITLYEYKAKCLRVLDGDTIEAEIDVGFTHRFKTIIRLYGINTPELIGPDRNKALLAKAYVSDKIFGEDIIIRTYKDKTEKYGRYLADIFYGEDERFLNQELIQEGLAEAMVF